MSMPATNSDRERIDISIILRPRFRAVGVEVLFFFAIMFSIYVCMLAPSVTSNDAGELAAAAQQVAADRGGA